jgi:hypothetical protein
MAVALIFYENIFRLIKELNAYSWSLIIAFIGVSFAMEHHSHSVPFEGFFMSLPLVSIVVYWSQKVAPLIYYEDDQLSKQSIFSRDLFLMNFGFILSCMISLLTQYDNSDARGWWPFILIIMSLYGLIFAFAFSLIALLLENHKTYLMVFSFITLVIFSLSKFWPYFISVPFIGEIHSYSVIIYSMIICHLLWCLGFKLKKLVYKN